MERRQVRVTDPLVRPLLDGLEHEYRVRYGVNDELSRTDEADFDPPGGGFIVFVADAVTVAGGGYRAHAAGVCEVKRMWTNPDYRRRGLATLVLDALEDAARGAGYRRLVLETGPRQPEAAAMYERRGYVRIARYGRYPQALAFATELDQAAPST